VCCYIICLIFDFFGGWKLDRVIEINCTYSCLNLIHIEGDISMSTKLVNVGFGNSVVSNRVVAIISPNAAPVKRLRDEARLENRLIDATQGRRTRSVIITDSNHVILSAIQTETIVQRFSHTGSIVERDLKV